MRQSKLPHQPEEDVSPATQAAPTNSPAKLLETPKKQVGRQTVSPATGAARSNQGRGGDTTTGGTKKKKKKKGTRRADNDYDDDLERRERDGNPLLAPSAGEFTNVFNAIKTVEASPGRGDGAGLESNPNGTEHGQDEGAAGGGGAVLHTQDDDLIDDDMHIWEDTEEGGGQSSSQTVTKGGFDLLHVMLAILVVVPCIYHIVMFGLHIQEDSHGVNGDHTINSKLVIQLTSVVVALLREQQIAALLFASTTGAASGGVNVGENGVGISELFALRRSEYLEAITYTDEKIFTSLKDYSVNEPVISDTLLQHPLSEFINIAELEKHRDQALKGGDPMVVTSFYTQVTTTVSTFARHLQIRNVVWNAPAEAVALTQAMTTVQKSLMTGLRLLQESVSGKTYTGASLDIYTRIFGVWDVMEWMRYATSKENHEELGGYVVREAAGTIGVAEMRTLPKSTLIAALTRLEGSASRGTKITILSHWNASQPVETLQNSVNFFNRILLEDEGDMKEDSMRARAKKLGDNLFDDYKVRFGLILACFIIAVLCLFSHMGILYWSRSTVEVRRAHDKDVRVLRRSMMRMSKFVERLSGLQTVGMGAALKKSQRLRSGVPSLESGLYALLSHVKDLEMYLPPTVTHPPPDVSKEALTRNNLFTKSALFRSSGVVAIRTSLSSFHSSFASAGVKQKALQHQMTRYLALMAQLAEDHSEGHEAILNVFGDHAVLFLNVLKKIDYPVLKACNLCFRLVEETLALGYNTPQLVLCCGDVLVGHVGAASTSYHGSSVVSSRHAHSSSSQVVSSLLTFGAFGPLSQDLSAADHVGKLHEHNIVANNAAARSFHNERQLLDSDAFGGGPLAPSGGESPRGARSPQHQHMTPQLNPLLPNSNTAQNTTAANGGGKKAITTGVVDRARWDKVEQELTTRNVCFRPLEVIGGSLAADEEDAYLDIDQGESNIELSYGSVFKEYSWTMPAPTSKSGAENQGASHSFLGKGYAGAASLALFPVYGISMFPSQQDAPEIEAMHDWVDVFDKYVGAVKVVDNNTVSNAIEALIDYNQAYRQLGPDQTYERVAALLRTCKASNYSRMEMTVADLKRSRLSSILSTS